MLRAHATALARIASDHLPVHGAIEFPPGPLRNAESEDG